MCKSCKEKPFREAQREMDRTWEGESGRVEGHHLNKKSLSSR